MNTPYFKTIALFILLIIPSALFSQNIGINTAGSTPSVNAILDLNTGNSRNLGFLNPNVKLGASLTTFNPPIANAVTAKDSGMIVYNSVATNQAIGYYYWNGTTWVNLSAATNAWLLTGNAGTTPGTNFVGTTDNKALEFKTDNIFSGILDHINQNAYFGTSAGNNAGQYNVAMGYQALAANVPSSGYNVAIGYWAMNSNITTQSVDPNTAVGAWALYGNLTGSDNTAIGYGAGAYYGNVGGAGSQNTSVGSLAYLSEYNGNANTIVGFQAMTNNDGTNNTVLGNNALSNTYGTASENTVLGANAGLNFITSGNFNTLIGDSARFAGAFSSYNYATALGYNSIAGSNATAIGYDADATQANSLVLGAINGVNGAGANTNVAIGTQTPKSSFDVKGNAAFGAYAGANAAPVNGVIVSGQVGVGTATPNAGAALDVTSTTQGILIPRLPSNPGAYVTSLLYYNTTTNCFMFYNGSAWQAMVCACSGPPSTPGAISGPTSFCPAGTATYTVAPVAGATYYTWTVPSGSIITSGQGTNSINVTFGSSNGNITVTATNSCGPSNASVLVVGQMESVPITLTNNQVGATPANFQQMITVNSNTYSAYESSGLQNVEFTTGPGATGTVLQAWIESGATNTSTSTVYWVNIPTSISGGGGTYTLYINFMVSNVMNVAGPTGEAPQLSGTYAQYDNGALVFTSCYTRWGGLSGGSVPAGISTIGNKTITNFTNYTQITFTGGLNTTNGTYYTTMPATANTYPTVLDTYLSMYGMYQWFGTSNGFNQQGNGVIVTWDQGYSASDFGIKSNAAATGITTAALSNTACVWSILIGSSTSLTSVLQNYNSVFGTAAVTANAPTYFGYFGTTQNGGSNYMYIYWTRTRIYPPSGVMPTVTFGAIVCP